jgi:hypothetical protein
MTTFGELPVGAKFTQSMFFGVVLSQPTVLTKVDEYKRGPYSSVNTHSHNTYGHLCRSYTYDYEEVTIVAEEHDDLP